MLGDPWHLMRQSVNLKKEVVRMSENEKTTPAGAEVVNDALDLLIKQMKLLSERSHNCEDSDLPKISDSMLGVYEAISYSSQRDRFSHSELLRNT